jgi:hypothetical protein
MSETYQAAAEAAQRLAETASQAAALADQIAAELQRDLEQRPVFKTYFS